MFRSSRENCLSLILSVLYCTDLMKWREKQKENNVTDCGRGMFHNFGDISEGNMVWIMRLSVIRMYSRADPTRPPPPVSVSEVKVFLQEVDRTHVVDLEFALVLFLQMSRQVVEDGSAAPPVGVEPRRASDLVNLQTRLLVWRRAEGKRAEPQSNIINHNMALTHLQHVPPQGV